MAVDRLNFGLIFLPICCELEEGFLRDVVNGT